MLISSPVGYLEPMLEDVKKEAGGMKQVELSFDALPEWFRKKVLAGAEHEYADFGIGGDEESVRDAHEKTSGPNAIQNTNVAVAGSDTITDRAMRVLEEYNKELDEAVLASQDVVKAYNEMIEGDAKKAWETIKKYEDELIAHATGERSMEDEVPDVSTMIYAGCTQLQTIYSLLVNQYNEYMDILGDPEEGPLNLGDMRKLATEWTYEPKSTPQEIKAQLQYRITMCNAQLQTFRNMVRMNYNILGITKAEAELLTTKLDSKDQKTWQAGVREVKELIAKNESKFHKDTIWDLRSLGYGVLFTVSEDDGFLGPHEVSQKIDRTLQLLSTHDAVVIGHGAYENEAMADLRKRADKLAIDLKRYYEQRYNAFKPKWDKAVAQVPQKVAVAIGSAIEKTDKTINATFGKIDKKSWDNYDPERADKIFSEYKEAIDEVLEQLNDAINDVWKDAVEASRENYADDGEKAQDQFVVKSFAQQQATISQIMLQKYMEIFEESDGADARWTIQPIKSIDGSKYEDVNELVKSLLNNGFKNILLLSCNPGGQKLDKETEELRKRMKAKVEYPMSSVVVESSAEEVDGAGWNMLDDIINETSAHLDEFVMDFGLDEFDDDIVEDDYAMLVESFEPMNEVTAAELWAKIKAIVRKAAAAVVGWFKKMLAFLAAMIKKIRENVKSLLGRAKSGKLSSPVPGAVFLVEDAQLRQYQIKDIASMEKEVVSACEKINRKVSELEREQTENFRRLEAFADKQASGAEPQMESLMRLIMR